MIPKSIKERKKKVRKNGIFVFGFIIRNIEENQT